MHSIPRRGRPTHYDSSAIEAICSIVRTEGVSDTAAARRLGFSKTTISRWKIEHPELRDALTEAREQFSDTRLQKLLEAQKSANPQNWRAAARLLVHVFPEDYSLNPKRRSNGAAIPEPVDTEAPVTATVPVASTPAHPVPELPKFSATTSTSSPTAATDLRRASDTSAEQFQNSRNSPGSSGAPFDSCTQLLVPILPKYATTDQFSSTVAS
jgi:hypothetical protein